MDNFPPEAEAIADLKGHGEGHGTVLAAPWDLRKGHGNMNQSVAALLTVEGGDTGQLCNSAPESPFC